MFVVVQEFSNTQIGQKYNVKYPAYNPISNYVDSIEEAEILLNKAKANTFFDTRRTPLSIQTFEKINFRLVVAEEKCMKFILLQKILKKICIFL